MGNFASIFSAFWSVWLLCDSLIELKKVSTITDFLTHQCSFSPSRIQYGSHEGRHSIRDPVELRPKLGRWWGLKHLLLYAPIRRSAMVASEYTKGYPDCGKNWELRWKKRVFVNLSIERQKAKNLVLDDAALFWALFSCLYLFNILNLKVHVTSKCSKVGWKSVKIDLILNIQTGNNVLFSNF